jgi:hypothetical protein
MSNAEDATKLPLSSAMLKLWLLATTAKIFSPNLQVENVN